MDPSELINSIAQEASKWRRELHQRPQTMYEETFASDFIAGKLSELGIPHTRGIAQTGVVATIEGRRKDSENRLHFALTWTGRTSKRSSASLGASKFPGEMYACGHTSTIPALP
jgi:metal-dependent amidase/aminoacylase/carboxypeptidase family protein